MHILLTGATGLVGSHVLRALLSDTSVTKITVLSRRAVPAATTEGGRASVIQHADFGSYPASLGPALSDVAGVIWALGVSQAAVDAAEYERVTREFPLRLAEFLAAAAPAVPAASEAVRGSQGAQGSGDGAGAGGAGPPAVPPAMPPAMPPATPPVNFVYISGEGATHAPGRVTPRFGRVKGEAEKALIEFAENGTDGESCERKDRQRKLNVYAVRPAVVVPDKDGGGATSALQKLVGPVLVPALRLLRPAMLSPAGKLAEVLVALAKGDGKPLEGEGVEGGRVVTNVGVRRLAGL